ncbi:MAG: sigma-70 family RNA polymerase sigma factor [Asticcacaulis sp.]
MLTPVPSSNVHVGSRLRARRIALNMSPERLAGSLYVSALKLSDYEAGRTRISHQKLKLAAIVLQVEERYFYEGLTVATTIEVVPDSWVRDVDRWFADFVVPYERQYLWIARRILRDDDIARDLVHDAYAGVLAGDAWKAIAIPRAYVMRMVFNLAVNRVRRAKIVPMQALPDVETLDYAARELDGFEAVSIREQMKVGLAAIQGLPDMTRRVITMRRLDALPVKEIAYRLGISVKGVEYHIARGAFLFTQAVQAAEMDRAQKIEPIGLNRGVKRGLKGLREGEQD